MGLGRILPAMHFLALPFLVACLATGLMAADKGPDVPDDTSPAITGGDTSKLGWWRHDRFGMFIHWGLYAQEGCHWQGKDGRSEHMMRHLQIPLAEYRKIGAVFNPTAFKAEEWVRIAKGAGMTYMVLTSKHHDGFAMYDSASSDFDLFDGSPWKRDAVGELAKACAAGGLKFGVYYSLGRDWQDPDASTANARRSNTWDYPDEAKKDFARYFKRKVIPQVTELLTNYGPIAVLWFDTPEQISKAQSKELADLIHRIQPSCIINQRIGNGLGDYEVAEQMIPKDAAAKPWETCMTLNNHWGFYQGDEQWKPTATLVQNLVDVVSKGGNYLLNVGPDGLGKIPAGSQERLAEVGSWMTHQGESIRGCAGLAKIEVTGMGKTDWRVTAKPGTAYLHLFKWPAGNPVTISGLPSAVRSATLLGATPITVEAKTAGGTCTLTLPAQPANALDSVIRLELTAAAATK